jgi:ribose transport system substrate-binding protein
MRRKLLSLILATAMVATMLVGCGSKNETTQTGKDNSGTGTTDSSKDTATDNTSDDGAAKGGLVYLVSKGFQHQFWQAVYQGAQKAASELGVELKMEGPATESDIADQVQMLNNAVNQKPLAIGLAALDTEACLDGITAAMNAKIPIIGFDSGVSNAPEGAVYASASTDNYAAGILAAQETYKLIESKLAKGVKIGVLSQDATAESIINRGQGFIDEMKKLIEAAGFTVSVEGHAKFENVNKDADIVIQVAVPASVTLELSVIDAQNMLIDDSYICIYGSNQHSAQALVTADENLKKLGADGVIGIGFDAGKVVKDAVADGRLAGAVTQDPLNIGYMTVQLAVKAANGETVEDMDTGCQWYTSQNMNDDNIAPNLYD